MAKKQPSDTTLPVSVKHIERSIYVIRDHKIMLDSDLAELYGVETRVLNQAVTRNRERFPEDFMFGRLLIKVPSKPGGKAPRS